MIYIQTNMQLGGTGPSRPDTLIIMNKYLKEGKTICRLSSLKGLSGQNRLVAMLDWSWLPCIYCTSRYVGRIIIQMVPYLVVRA